MATLNFLFHLAGATMLLLFAVRMVRTGIERSYGATFQRLMMGQRSLTASAGLGVGLAVVLQSSAAVALLTAGFASSGLVGFATGLAIVLGGDLGSALIIQILSFDLEWLVPVLLTVGGYLFVKTEARSWRQAGRIILGIAFILISLRFLREAMDPIRDSAFLPAISGYLARDFVTAFLVGGALAFVMHSSVAAILMCVTLVQIGAIPFAAGLSLMIGANAGSALIPVWLTRGMTPAGRRVPYANLVLRGGWAVAFLFAANLALASGLLGDPQGGQNVVNAHLIFNGLLLLVALPFARWLEHPLTRALPDQIMPGAAAAGLTAPALDHASIRTPLLAVSELKRELLRMVDMVEAMFRPALSMYETGDREQMRLLRAQDREVNHCLSEMRKFVAAIPSEGFGRDNYKAARDCMEYAIRLETAGDVVSARMTDLADELRKSGAKFSREGWTELVRMHESILANLKLASNVLLSDDLESARLLSLEKTEIKRAERDSRKRHLKRLQEGKTESFETSDIHLETLRALREFNSHISAVAYPILYKEGQLLETRLIEHMDDDKVAD